MLQQKELSVVLGGPFAGEGSQGNQFSRPIIIYIMGLGRRREPLLCTGWCAEKSKSSTPPQHRECMTAQMSHSCNAT